MNFAPFLTKSAQEKQHRKFHSLPPFASVTCFATSSIWLTGLSRPDVIGQNDSFGIDLTNQEDTRVKPGLLKLLRPAGAVENGIVIMKRIQRF